SSWNPGASPRKKIPLSSLPSPGTACFAVFQRGHALHARISSASWSRASVIRPPLSALALLRRLLVLPQTPHLGGSEQKIVDPTLRVEPPVDQHDDPISAT